MLKRPHYIALGLVVLVTLVILNLPAKRRPASNSASAACFCPCSAWPTPSSNKAATAGDAVAAARGTAAAKRQLFSAQNQELRLQLMQAEGMVARKRPAPRNCSAGNSTSRWKLKLAKVVLRDPANWWRTVQIDLGSRDGVRVNFAGADRRRPGRPHFRRQPDALPGGAAGRSQLQGRRAGGKPRARDTGVIGGSARWTAAFVEMGYLSSDAELKPGQNVWTSGLGGIFPERHSDRQNRWIRDSDDYGLSTEARVKLAANLSALGGSVGDDGTMNWLNTILHPARRLPGGVLGSRVSRACAICSARKSICCPR